MDTERFANRYIIKNGHWLWTGYLDKDGYGTFYFRRKLRRAHRVSYFMFRGEIEAGMVIDHICGVRNCVNPEHLRMITSRENSLDSMGVGAQNARKTHCKFGHNFDRVYGKQRYCSVCQSEKAKRLRKKWRENDTVKC